MSKIIGDFWLSPDGEVFYCNFHNSMADDIVRRRGWMDKLFEQFENHQIWAPDPEQFLEKLGWVKHCDRPWYHGWCIPSGTKLTQAQIDKIYELCGEIPEDSDLLWPCICEVIFCKFKFICFRYNNWVFIY